MAKKKIKLTEQKTSLVKRKISNWYIIIGIITAVLLAFLIYNNFIRKSEVDMEYYTFAKEGELVFFDSTGNAKCKIDLEIADTDYERQLGLMKRVSMEENQGMLFIFPVDAMQSFWMRNTLISLDMIFINSNKKIVTIHKNTKVLSDQSYPSTSPARYVLEVNAGFTAKNNIQVGDKVGWTNTR